MKAPHLLHKWAAVALLVLLLPYACPAPLIYTPGVGWKYAKRDPGALEGTVTGQPATTTSDAPAIPLVGELSRPDALVFEGNHVFSRAQLLHALTRRLEFHLAGHPCAPLAGFEQALQEMVRAGYLRAGFPDVKITVDAATNAARLRIKVEEGPRYLCGPIELRGPTNLTTTAIHRTLAEALGGHMPKSLAGIPEDDTPETKAALRTGPRSRKFFRFEGSDLTGAVQGKGPAQDFNTNLLSPYFLHCRWDGALPAPFDELARHTLRARARSVLVMLGYTEPKVEVAITPDSARHHAILLLTVADESPQGVITEIEITGARKNTRQQVLDFLELKPGLAADLRMVTSLSNRLWASGRFIEQTVTLPALTNSGQFKLAIELVELETAPLLNEDFSPEQQALLNLRDWLLRWDRQPENLVFELAGEAQGIAANAEVVLSGAGTAARFWGAPTNSPAALAYAVVAAPRFFGFYSPQRQQKYTRAAGFFDLKINLSMHPVHEFGVLNQLDVTSNLGFTTYESPDDADLPVGLVLDLDPAAFIKMAGETACRLEDGVLTVKLDLEEGLETSFTVDARTGRWLDSAIAMQGERGNLRLRIRTVEGAFERAVNELAAATDEHPNVFQPGKAVSSWLAFAAADGLRLAHWLMSQMGSPRPHLQALAAVQTMDLGQLFAPLDGWWPALAERMNEGPFSIPLGNPLPLPPGLAQLIQQYLVAALQTSDAWWPAGTWPGTFMREAIFGLMGQNHHTRAAITRLAQDDATGPLAWLLAGGLFGETDPVLAEFCAQQALARLSPAAVKTDLNTLLGDRTAGGRFASYSLTALNSLDETSSKTLLALLDAESAEDFGEVWQWIRQHHGEPFLQALQPLVERHWEDEVRLFLVGMALDSLSALAGRWEAEGKPARAAQLYRETLASLPPPEHDDGELAAELTQRLARILQQQGDLTGAAQACQKLLHPKDTPAAEQHLMILSLLLELGEALAKQGKSAEAADCYQNALDLQKRLPKVAPELRFNALIGLSVSLCRQEKLAEAEPVARETIDAAKGIFGDQHANVAALTGELGAILYHLGKLPEAEAACRETVQRRKQRLSPDDPDLIKSYQNLAVVLAAQQQAEAVKQTYGELLDWQKIRLPAHDPAIGKTLFALAQTLEEMGKLAEAEARFREALTLAQSRHAAGGEEGAHLLHHLAVVVANQGRFPEAVELGALAIAADPQTHNLFCSRAAWLARQGKWEAAAADLRQAVQLAPVEDWDMQYLAIVLLQTGDTPAYRAQGQAMLARYGATDDPVIACRVARACLLAPAQGDDLKAACQLAERALTLGPTNKYLAYFRFGKGLAAYREGQFHEAVKWTRQMLGLPEATDNTQTNWCREVWAYAVLAMAHQQLQQPAEAKAALAQAVELFQTKLPKLDSGDLGNNWPDWLTARILLNEAKALIEKRSPNLVNPRSEN